MSQGEGGGRPTKYRAVFCKQAKKLCQLGATDWDLAQFFEVALDTITRWKLEHPKFSVSTKLGKGASDRRVEQSLFRRATGYSFNAVKIFIDEGKPLIVEYVEHVPPSDTAAIFWLKNRRKDRWRDFKAVELSTPVGRPLAMTYVPKAPELLQDYYAKVTQSAAAADPHPAAARDLGSNGQGGDEPGDGEGFSPR
jgi:hypothetical protein